MTASSPQPVINTNLAASASDYDPATNRRQTVATYNPNYDAAGNQRQLLPSLALTYDAENRVVTAGTASYAYDGDGRRVQKTFAGTTTTFVYDMQGQLAAEYTDGAVASAPCATCYFSYDHLGSVRMMTNENGVLVARHDYLPFGEEIMAGTLERDSSFAAADSATQRYTGKERDSESGLDYFGARYYGSALGRFTSPDPSGLDFADLTNPQSLNLYAFVMNNPLSSVDPNGLSDEPCGGGGSVVASKGEGDGPDPCGGGVDPAPKPLPPDKDCAGKDCQQDPVSVANDMGTVLKVLDKQGTCTGYALREVAALGEGMDREPDSGYGTVVKGTVYGAPQQFAGLIGTDNAHVPDYSSLQGHPHIHVWVNSKTTSDAFGRYQIMGRSAGGMADFSRAGQDAYADRLMRARGAVGYLLGGNFSAAMAKASKEWASLPFSPYGQPTISLKSAAERFLLAVSVCR